MPGFPRGVSMEQTLVLNATYEPLRFPNLGLGTTSDWAIHA